MKRIEGPNATYTSWYDIVVHSTILCTSDWDGENRYRKVFYYTGMYKIGVLSSRILQARSIWQPTAVYTRIKLTHLGYLVRYVIILSYAINDSNTFILQFLNPDFISNWVVKLPDYSLLPTIHIDVFPNVDDFDK